jgi:hypothetical protein
VRCAVSDALESALNCHCSGCRRTTGSAFMPVIGIPRDRFSVTSGEDNLMIHGEATDHDAHCRRCGSLLY